MVYLALEHSLKREEYGRLMHAFANIGNEPDDPEEEIDTLVHAFSSHFAETLFRGIDTPPIDELRQRAHLARKCLLEKGEGNPDPEILQEIAVLRFIADTALLAHPFAIEYRHGR